jgi:hypothetical protein
MVCAEDLLRRAATDACTQRCIASNGECLDSENQRVEPENRKKSFLRWPTEVLGPAPGLKELNVACWGWFAAVLVIQFCFPLLLRIKAGAGWIHIFPSDFVYFYGIGRIANGYSLARLYDYSLQLKTFNEIFPFHLHQGGYGPSPYPPFVALFFSLFARFSVVPAFFLWAGVSLALYLAGIAAAIHGVFPGERLKVSLIFASALAFCPFLQDTLSNGQISTLAVFGAGLAVMQERKSRPFASGLALSMLAYKPTLLLLLIPMLLLTRRFRTLGGFVAGSSLLALAATAFGGLQIWASYARFLGVFSQFVGFKGQSTYDLSMYVDIKSFMQAVSGGWSRTELVFFMALAIAMAALLAVLFWNSAKGGRPAQSIAWATALTWTLLLNIYVPVYDSALLAIAAVLALGALRELEWKTAMGWMSFLAVFTGVVSWELETIAQSKGVQFLPILLAVFGLGELYILREAIRRGLPRAATEPATG